MAMTEKGVKETKSLCRWVFAFLIFTAIWGLEEAGRHYLIEGSWDDHSIDHLANGGLASFCLWAYWGTMKELFGDLFK